MEQSQSRLTKRGHRHAEAFCRMTYADKEGNREIIWNSRDGVTPFICHSREGKEQQHIEFHNATYDPCYIPDIGERVWVDMTREKAEAIARRQIEADNKKEWRKHFRSKDQAIAFLADGLWHEGTAPMLVEVDEALQEVFRTRAIDGIQTDPTTQTCPSRMNQAGPWEQKANLDKWATKPNGDRTCSFCGSLHPEDFEKFCNDLLTDETMWLEVSTKGYKVYLRRRDVENASQGAIKYYKWHSDQSDPVALVRRSELFAQALALSQGRIQTHIASAIENYTKTGE